jgi:hypothetical protein
VSTLDHRGSCNDLESCLELEVSAWEDWNRNMVEAAASRSCEHVDSPKAWAIPESQHLFELPMSRKVLVQPPWPVQATRMMMQAGRGNGSLEALGSEVAARLEPKSPWHMILNPRLNSRAPSTHYGVQTDPSEPDPQLQTPENCGVPQGEVSSVNPCVQ